MRTATRPIPLLPGRMTDPVGSSAPIFTKKETP